MALSLWDRGRNNESLWHPWIRSSRWSLVRLAVSDNPLEPLLVPKWISSKRTKLISSKQICQVNRIDGDPWKSYETELANFSELDASFFTGLDAQFNKVNRFYQNKEKDLVVHADVLEKQMQAVVEMRRVFSEQQRYQHLPAAAPGSDDDNHEGR